MSLRKYLKVGGVPVLHAKVEEPHSKVVDYSGNRLHELGGFPLEQMVAHKGRPCIAVIDTETTCENGDNFGKPLTYDIGVTIVLKETGEPVHKACWIIQDIFCDAKLMKGAYFTNRTLTDYPFILANRIGKLCSFVDAVTDLTYLFKAYNVKAFAAYNSAFDTKAFDATAQYINRVYGHHTDFGLVCDLRQGSIDVLDLWAASCMTFMCHDEYKQSAYIKHWLTNTNNFQTSAEAANNFIHGSEVGEDHTALSDTAIEAGIYQYILGLPEGREVLDLCYNNHGETWAYVNNLGTASALKWAKANGFTCNV